MINMDETIITIDELLDKVSHIYKDNSSIDEIQKAFKFANERLEGKLRNSGTDYINHALTVAYILVDLNVDEVTIVAAILHDLLDKDVTTVGELKMVFGEPVAKLCENVHKINKLELLNDSESAAIYLRKVLVGIAEDVRVIFIKLADRLHNMRTLWAVKEEKQKQTANETVNVLIPIAHRLGINSIKSELEDLCLKYLKPDIYNDILAELSESRETLNNILIEMKESLSDILTDHGIKCEIKGRVKSVHSIYKKLSTGRKFSDIYDILALRVFLEKESDCYLAVGLIHSKYRPVPKRFKDYIAIPKRNGYQSLHTSIFGIDGYLFEVQLRTYEMDEIAEKGVASHVSYKEKGTIKAQNLMEQKLELFRSLIEANNELASDLEFASNANNEFLSELIYVYTPKGDVVELPKEATPVDFAYRIHSNVGERCVGAIVNNTISTLDKPLNDGDIVEIKTLKTGKPNKEWLTFVKTSQARSKIKAYFSKQDREEYVARGESLLDREIKKRKLANNDILNPDSIKKILADLKLSTLEEVYLSIGSLRYTAAYVIDLVFEDKKAVQDILIDKMNRTGFKEEYKNDVIIAGTDNIKVNMAKCCKPIQGDSIIGYVTKGEGISIHRIDCSNIAHESNRLIKATWNDLSDKFYITNLFVEVQNGKNYLIDIVTLAGQKNVFVENFETHNKDLTLILDLTIKTKNRKDLNSFILDLENQKYTIKVTR